MDVLIPNNTDFFTENEISNYVTQQFFRCVRPFLSWMKKGETYWFEYHNNGEYEISSDNNLGQKFEMTTHQLLSNFYPVECETDICAAMDYAYRLGELGFDHWYIEEISAEILKQMNNSLDFFKDAVDKVYKMDYSAMTSYISVDKLEEIISKQVKKEISLENK